MCQVLISFSAILGPGILQLRAYVYFLVNTRYIIKKRASTSSHGGALQVHGADERI